MPPDCRQFALQILLIYNAKCCLTLFITLTDYTIKTERKLCKRQRRLEFCGIPFLAVQCFCLKISDFQTQYAFRRLSAAGIKLLYHNIPQRDSDMPSCARRDIFACGKSDIAPLAQRYYIHPHTREANITRWKSEHHCAAISLAVRRI